MMNVGKVIGKYLRSPPIFFMSCWLWRAWMTDPAARNNRALKKACMIMWNSPDV